LSSPPGRDGTNSDTNCKSSSKDFDKAASDRDHENGGDGVAYRDASARQEPPPAPGDYITLSHIRSTRNLVDSRLTMNTTSTTTSAIRPLRALRILLLVQKWLASNRRRCYELPISKTIFGTRVKRQAAAPAQRGERAEAASPLSLRVNNNIGKSADDDTVVPQPSRNGIAKKKVAYKSDSDGEVDDDND
jgi:hypothetical protein